MEKSSRGSTYSILMLIQIIVARPSFGVAPPACLSEEDAELQSRKRLVEMLCCVRNDLLSRPKERWKLRNRSGTRTITILTNPKRWVLRFSSELYLIPHGKAHLLSLHHVKSCRGSACDKSIFHSQKCHEK
jgi:hypothetical protein